MRALLIFFLLIANSGCGGCGCGKRWDVLSTEEKVTLHRILTHWETWVPERKKEGTAPLMTFEELYAGLRPREKEFLDRVRAIRPRGGFGCRRKPFESPADEVKFKRLDEQWIERKGVREKIDPQYLPENVHEAYERMMQTMEKDLGRRLYIESGYRSPAYQLYTLLFYTPKHHYSLAETRQWVALPGYSEHGAPGRQAIDFINEEGINGDDSGQTAEDFEGLPEYRWLQENAREFGFELSYPRRKKGVTFEPWHWRYRGKKEITST